MADGEPDFSIIVPAHERPEALAECLAALANLDFPAARFETLVVDDGSRVRPDEIVSRFCDRLNVRLLATARRGPAGARNEGARHAKGRFLVFVDDDCAPQADWLGALSKRLQADQECAVGGRTVNGLSRNVYSAASQMQVTYLYSWYNAEPANARFLCSNNLVVTAEGFRVSGGFDGEWPLAGGEDREFCERWSRCGYRMIYAPEAIVNHRHKLTFASFCRQHFRYGRGAGHLRRRRHERSQTSRFEPFRFYWGLMCHPFSQVSAAWAFVFCGLQMVSQVAALCGLLYETVAGRASLGALAKSRSVNG
jgi:GT2 family glycosyltransferase